MKILQLNCVYGNGSTGKLVESNSRILRSMGHEVFTCYGNGPDYEDGHSLRVTNKNEHLFNAALSRVTGVPLGGLFRSNKIVLDIIGQLKPDVIHVHCVNGHSFNVYKLLRDIAKTQIKTVVTLHAEFFHTGSCSHACDCEQWKTECRKCEIYKYETASIFFNRANKSWKLMSQAFSYFDRNNIVITAVSPWLANRASQSSILKKYDIKYVPNGVNTAIFRFKGDVRKQSSNIITFVTPIFTLEQFHLKGGFYLPKIAEALPDVNINIVASKIDDGVNLELLPKNVCYLGKAANQDQLADYYNRARITLLLSKRETFSMVTAESLCCGTPVIGFKAGGPESIALNKYTDFVDYGDINQLIDTVKKWYVKSFDNLSISEIARVAYSEHHMAESYLQIYNSFFR